MLFKLGTLDWRIAIGLAGILPIALGYLFCFLRSKRLGSLDSVGALTVTVAFLFSFLFLTLLSFDFEKFQGGGKPFSHHIEWAMFYVTLFFVPLPASIVFAILALLFWVTPVRLPFVFISLFFQVLHFINLASILAGGEGWLGGASI